MVVKVDAGRVPEQRSLLYFPIVHTHADLGALGDLVQRIKIKKLGKRAWSRNVRLIEDLWARIEREVAGLNLNFERVRVYQDGMPHCGHEIEIATELARAGSRNHQLLLSLHERGARIMGTESPELLLEEYRQITKDLARESGSDSGPAETETSKETLLKRRDQYIAGQINSTLEDGETGILFLGMLHSLTNLLAKDIRLVFPVDASSGNGGIVRDK